MQQDWGEHFVEELRVAEGERLELAWRWFVMAQDCWLQIEELMAG